MFGLPDLKFNAPILLRGKHALSTFRCKMDTNVIPNIDKFIAQILLGGETCFSHHVDVKWTQKLSQKLTSLLLRFCSEGKHAHFLEKFPEGG